MISSTCSAWQSLRCLSLGEFRAWPISQQLQLLFQLSPQPALALRAPSVVDWDPHAWYRTAHAPHKGSSRVPLLSQISMKHVMFIKSCFLAASHEKTGYAGGGGGGGGGGSPYILDPSFAWCLYWIIHLF